MIKIPEADYRNYISWAAGNTSNRVYPLSIAEGFQSGDIFVDDPADTRAVLFWHFCGFGYISGDDPAEAFLDDIYEEMFTERSGRRLVLITDNEDVKRYFHGKDVELGLRAEYRFPCGDGIFADPVAESRYFAQVKIAASVDTERFRIERIDEGNIAGIRGRIIPSFSWESNEHFLEKGFGYATVAHESVCAVAFSSAVSSDEVDIGVETREEYRGNGLAAALAAMMCEEIIAIGKKPVWAHATSNVGSMKTALRCGFVEEQTNTVIRKK